MPSFDELPDSQKKAKTIKSAFDSETFDADITIHVDGLVGSATISPSGRDVALASPDGLAIIDLDSPYSSPRRLSSHGLPWLVVDVQWSPFAVRDYWVASTANHRCLVWNLNLRNDSTSGAIEHSLQGHSRAITDINFSAHHPDMLATCSVDGYVHCWDLRRPRQPAITFCDWFAGATQVKYNRQESHILASSHDRWLHIWDDRKPAQPLITISAHTSKIYGLDWNRTRSTGVVTCSLDKSIKFWDYEKDRNAPERVIRTDFPVWRARHTPFGWGLLAMPQTEPGRLYLYDRRSKPGVPQDGVVDPVAVFDGHGSHKVKEFLWRFRGGINDEEVDDRDFQLVSWGEDNELRLQRMDQGFLESVGYVKGGKARKNLQITRKGAAYKTFRAVDDGLTRDRRSATMSDVRPGSRGREFRRSGVSLSLHAGSYKATPTWRGPSMKAKTLSKDPDRSQTQIGWMRGVTMTRRKAGPDAGAADDSKDSAMFGSGFRHDDEWGEPESVEEEVVRISNQLPNVKWENIDMDALTLSASMKGPWGVGGESTFIKVKVDIPSAYPKHRAPRFTVERSSFIPAEIHKLIETELHQLAAQFLKRKQNCLDVAFSYLLGEVDLESSTSLFKNVKDLDDDDDDPDALADESSSEDDDDDDDIPAGGSAAMSQELSASTELEPANTFAATTRRLVMPPLPRFCGARFSNDGRLVCFFPTKEEQSKTSFAMPESYRDKSKTGPSFAGFGRIAQDSAPPRQRFGNEETSATEEPSEASDESDGSSSSTDSELTALRSTNLWYQPIKRFRKTMSTDDSMRSSGGGTGGAGTGTGTGTTARRRPGKPRNIISIYDIRSELPSKKQFAQEYAIFGDGADVCEHNAKVAGKYGKRDLVDIWRYAALLLRSDIPLELHQPHPRKESVLVIARDTVARADEVKLSGRVKWGSHPLAKEFIHDLFEYFEKLADIQMLAMLSCIFGESVAEDSVAYAESHLPQPETPLPMKAPAFSLEYFPADPGLWALRPRSQASSSATTPRTAAQTPLLFYSDSQGSEDVVWTGDPASNSYSAGETPPLKTKTGRERVVEGSNVQVLSTSPNSRLYRRTNTATVASFAASLPRALAGAVTGPSATALPKKRNSPAEAALSSLAPNTTASTSSVTWGGSTVLGMPTETTAAEATARSSLSDDDRRRDDMTVLVPVAVHCVQEDRGLFDDDGWMSTPLLEASHGPDYVRYRYAYSELLHMWGQPLARLEILKFNILDSEETDGTASGTAADASHHESYAPSEATAQHQPANGNNTNGATSPTATLSLGAGRKDQLQALLASGRGLDVTGICLVHETQLDPLEYSPQQQRQQPTAGVGGAVGICRRCGPRRGPQRLLRCVYCGEPAEALYAACLCCGCVSHDACLAAWHAAGETLCPAGDECECVRRASDGQVESWSALRASLARNRLREREKQLPARDGEAGGAEEKYSTKRANIIGRLRGIEAAAGGRPRRTSVPAKLASPGLAPGELAGGRIESDDEGQVRSAHHRRQGSGRLSRTSMSRSAKDGEDDIDSDDDDDDDDDGLGHDGLDREDWESVASSQGIPSAAAGPSSRRPGSLAARGQLEQQLQQQQQPLSAARLSLLRKSVGAVGDRFAAAGARPANLRRKSGGVYGWRTPSGQ